jgi:hypothetical protein
MDQSDFRLYSGATNIFKPNTCYTNDHQSPNTTTACSKAGLILGLEYLIKQIETDGGNIIALGEINEKGGESMHK